MKNCTGRTWQQENITWSRVKGNYARQEQNAWCDVLIISMQTSIFLKSFLKVPICVDYGGIVRI